MQDVIVVIGPGQIGQAIARRVGVGKHVLLADMRAENAKSAAEVMASAGYDVSIAAVDASSREAVHALVQKATGLGNVTGLIHAAGVSPTQASPATILKVDLYGTALVLEEFGNVIVRGGGGVITRGRSYPCHQSIDGKGGDYAPPFSPISNRTMAETESACNLPIVSTSIRDRG